jgi:Lipase (class 3)
MDLKHYANLCRVAYQKDAIAQFTAMGYNAQLLPTPNSEEVYCLNKDGKLTIVLAGTNEPMDWLINLLAVPMGRTWDVHPEYAAIALALYTRIREFSDATDIEVTGHSKGGAIAALLGALLQCKTYSFGSPRIGSQRFSDTYPVQNYVRVGCACFDRA